VEGKKKLSAPKGGEKIGHILKSGTKKAKTQTVQQKKKCTTPVKKKMERDEAS